tara:strand:- start:636 stop:752 length:117 start_codon:yes stop_codon:yes gene_type:complete
MSRTMPAACGITEEEEKRRRLVAQVQHAPTAPLASNYP